jgi:hypothetical protein
MTRPLSLTNNQLQLLQRAVVGLPEEARRQFVEAVASKLGSNPGDHAFRRAINDALARITARGPLHVKFTQKEIRP